MARVLLLATTTGYQTRAFGEAAERLGVELVFATDRCGVLDDPWQDGAIPIRFHEEDASVGAIVAAAREAPIDGLLVVGDRPTVIAARVARELGVPWHPPAAAAAARHKLLTRERLRDAGLPVPWFQPFALSPQPSVSCSPPPGPRPQPPAFPCVVKPVSLSGSRGVMRVDDQVSLATSIERLRALLASPDVRAERNDAHELALVEGFIPGREYAVEGLMHRGAFHALAIFDKPDPLDGPFFEETIYITPSSAQAATQQAIVDAVRRATAAIGLWHGPVHAECRVSPSTSSGHVPSAHREPQGRLEQAREAAGSGQGLAVFVLEAAARPIGGLCARALSFDRPGFARASLEELLLRHALGESPDGWTRAADASGVMMIPIPRRGILRAVDGIDDARSVPDISDLRITAKMDQRLVPLPEGASYLGFIFASAPDAARVDRALRDAHARLRFTIDAEFPIAAAPRLDYNRRHG